ncbi:MAG: hypothetical protein Q8P10_02320 [bacterium]|nr:hypothetical protein [bacterium]
MPDIFVSKNTNNKIVDPKAEKNQNLNMLEVGSINPFTAFCKNPKDLAFYNQDEDEAILLFLRKHFVTNFLWILTGVVFLFAPILLLFIPLSTVFPAIPTPYVIILLLFYYLIVFNYFFVSFITWFYNISLVTQKRIVDLDFSDLVYKNVAETKLSLVQDVDYTQVGVIRSVFDYGDVFVQTASEKPNFDFLAVPTPAFVANLIEELIGRKREPA